MRFPTQPNNGNGNGQPTVSHTQPVQQVGAPHPGQQPTGQPVAVQQPVHLQQPQQEQYQQQQPSLRDDFHNLFGKILPAGPGLAVFEKLGISGADWFMLAKQYNPSQNNRITTAGLVMALLRSQAEGIPYHVQAYIPVCMDTRKPNEVWPTIYLYRWRAQMSGNYGGFEAVWSENIVSMQTGEGSNHVVMIPEWVNGIAWKFVGGVKVATQGCIVTAHDLTKTIGEAKGRSSWVTETRQMMLKKVERMALSKLYPMALEVSPEQQIAMAEATLRQAHAEAAGGVPTVVMPETPTQGQEYYDQYGEVHGEEVHGVLSSEMQNPQGTVPSTPETMDAYQYNQQGTTGEQPVATVPSTPAVTPGDAGRVPAQQVHPNGQQRVIRQQVTHAPGTAPTAPTAPQHPAAPATPGGPWTS